MRESVIPTGQMFIQFPTPIPEIEDTPEPRIWVKVREENLNGNMVSLFVDNRAMLRISLGRAEKISVQEKWYISDTYFGKCVREGKFVPFDDLREVERICSEMGYDTPRMDLP